MAKSKTRRKSRGLVLGHLERISSNVFERYRRVITGLVGGKNGIYALYRNDKLYYVGLATNLRGRVNQHLRDRHAGRWNYFSLYLARSERHMKELESLALRIADPKGNKVRGRLKGATDLRPGLKESLRKYALREIGILMGDGKKAAKKPQKKRKSAKMVKAGKKAAATRRKAGKNIPLKGLIKSRSLRRKYKGKMHYAWVLPSGRIKLRETGKIYDSPSGAGVAARKGKSTDGWRFWRYKNSKGEWVLLGELRK